MSSAVANDKIMKIRDHLKALHNTLSLISILDPKITTECLSLTQQYIGNNHTSYANRDQETLIRTKKATRSNL